LGRTDVIVLGGGPAGSATAITCALTGLRVVLVERSAFPRLVPGETLHPGVLPLLERLGVADDVLGASFLRHAGRLVSWGGPPRFVPFGGDQRGPWLGLQAWRPTFDEILLRRAGQVGVTIEQPGRPHTILQSRGAVTGIVTDRGRRYARFVVDATGRRSWLGQQLGLRINRVGPPLTAWYGYAVGGCPKRDEVPALSGDDTGWTWVARVRPGVYQWTRLSFDDQRPYPGWLPADLAETKPCGPVRGADVTWRMGSSPAGPGYFLVGDAAAVLDPAASHGVLKALMSGMYAGHLIVQVLMHAQPAAIAIETYRYWLRAWFKYDAERLSEFYSVLVGRPSWTASRPVLT
jgi:flavin-dependent dehydrogenase